MLAGDGKELASCEQMIGAVNQECTKEVGLGPGRARAREEWSGYRQHQTGRGIEIQSRLLVIFPTNSTDGHTVFFLDAISAKPPRRPAAGAMYHFNATNSVATQDTGSLDLSVFCRKSRRQTDLVFRNPIILRRRVRGGGAWQRGMWDERFPPRYTDRMSTAKNEYLVAKSAASRPTPRYPRLPQPFWRPVQRGCDVIYPAIARAARRAPPTPTPNKRT
ncbi:hypothetical protein FB451DRAFT_1364345 [Mycena latifolia]|nr:hypothetical protein FB451DRAFT_1364345 [Mycena latifolia]